jgi:hypothetical protein
VREIQKLNRSTQTFGLNEFGNGTKLILPVIKKTRYFLLDSDVATVYHQAKFYYQILEESLKESFLLVQNEIKTNKRKAEELKKAEELRRTQQLKRQTQPRTKATSPTKPSKPPTTGTKATSPTKP